MPFLENRELNPASTIGPPSWAIPEFEALAIRDMNHDGVADLAVATPARSMLLRGSEFFQVAGGEEVWTGWLGNNGFTNVAIADFDGDGNAEVVAGEPDSDYWAPGGSFKLIRVVAEPGSQVDVDRDVEFWHQDVPGVLGISQPGDRFGDALAVGDFNRDGNDDLAVGIPGKDLNGQADAGSIQILKGSASGLTTLLDEHWGQDLLPTVREQAGDRFGDALAAGDLNGDGYDDLAVGTPGEDVGGWVDAGSIHIFYGGPSGMTDGDSWNQARGSVPGWPGGGDRFGEALEMADFDGDGRDDLAIGVPGDGGHRGVVQIFYGDYGGFRVGPYWSAASAGVFALGSSFGATLSSGDFDGDGYADLAIGAPGRFVSDRGTVAVIHGSASGLVGDVAVFEPPPGTLRFGSFLAAGDLDGNGHDDLLAVADGGDRVYLFPGGPDMCSDGRDNDLDGRLDADDPDCAPGHPYEVPPSAFCVNRPGATDCWTLLQLGSDALGHAAFCSNGIDDDRDGVRDGDDPGCSDGFSERRDQDPDDYTCDNFDDDDGDGRSNFDPITWADPLHVAGFGDPACVPPNSIFRGDEHAECQDGIDNDGDGYTDFDRGLSWGGYDPDGADGDCILPHYPEGGSVPRSGDGTPRCGLGPEMGVLVPLLFALRKRRLARPAA